MSYLVFPRVRVQAANMLAASFLMGSDPPQPRGAGAIFLWCLFATATAGSRVHVRQVGQRQRLLFEKPARPFFAARGLCPSAREHHLGTGTGGGREGSP